MPLPGKFLMGYWSPFFVCIDGRMGGLALTAYLHCWGVYVGWLGLGG